MTTLKLKYYTTLDFTTANDTSNPCLWLTHGTAQQAEGSRSIDLSSINRRQDAVLEKSKTISVIHTNNKQNLQTK